MYQGMATASSFARSCPGTTFENSDFLVTAAQRKRLALSCCTVGFLLADLGVLVGRQEMLASVSACSLHGGIQLPQIPSAMSLFCHCPHQGVFVRMQCRERGIPGGCSPHSCLSKGTTLWGICSFSIHHKWDVQRNRCGVKFLSWENPMFHSIEGLL